MNTGQTQTMGDQPEKEKVTTVVNEVELPNAVDNVKKSKLEQIRKRRERGSKGPREYAESVQQLASPLTKATTHPGVHFKELGEYLSSRWRSGNEEKYAPSELTCLSTSSESYITVYDFQKNGAPDVTDVRTKDDFIAHACSAFDRQYLGKLIFLRGHQYPDVLNHIGAQYNVDPQFFRRHVDFDSLKRRPDAFSQCTLPSACTKIMQLSVTSIGTRLPIQAPGKQPFEKYQKQRLLTKAWIEKRAKLPNPQKHGVPQGKSIVRQLNIHDERYFSIEQNISIYVDNAPKGWIALVWSDFGQDLCPQDLADILECDPSDIRCLPTIQHRPSHRSNYTAEINLWGDDSQNEKASIFQNASALSHTWRVSEKRPEAADYANSLDPFYMLRDIFWFVISAEAQFLLIMRSKLEQELDRTSSADKSVPKTMILYDLDYNRVCLNRHIRQIKHLQSFVNGRDDLDWPQITPDPQVEQKTIDRSLRLLKRDLVSLLEDAKTLSSDFDAGMDLLMNAAMTDESHRAIEQAQKVTKLTALAFFFIPLSFVCSFFGMNFEEFTRTNGDNKMSVWIWAVTSFCIVTVAYLFLYWNSGRTAERISWPFRKRKVSSAQDGEI